MVASLDSLLSEDSVISIEKESVSSWIGSGLII